MKIPTFTDEQEAADWFATHDTAPYMDGLELVEEPIAVTRSRPAKKPVGLRIRAERIDKKQGPIWTCLLCLTVVLLSASCNSPSNQSPTPVLETNQLSKWHDQLAFAQEEAAKVDPAAAMVVVSASFDKNELLLNEATEVEFDFRRPSGKSISISITDAMPPELVRINTTCCEAAPPQEGELERYRTLVSNVKIGPREAAMMNLEEGSTYQQGPSVVLYLGTNYRTGVEGVWNIGYNNPQQNRGITLRVSALNGELLRRDD